MAAYRQNAPEAHFLPDTSREAASRLDMTFCEPLDLDTYKPLLCTDLCCSRARPARRPVGPVSL